MQDQYIYVHDCLRDAIERGLHLGEQQNVYANMALDPEALEDEEDEDAEPLYVNYEHGAPGRNFLPAHQAALLAFSTDSHA